MRTESGLLGLSGAEDSRLGVTPLGPVTHVQPGAGAHAPGTPRPVTLGATLRGKVEPRSTAGFCRLLRPAAHVHLKIGADLDTVRTLQMVST